MFTWQQCDKTEKFHFGFWKGLCTDDNIVKNSLFTLIHEKLVLRIPGQKLAMLLCKETLYACTHINSSTACGIQIIKLYTLWLFLNMHSSAILRPFVLALHHHNEPSMSGSNIQIQVQNVSTQICYWYQGCIKCRLACTEHLEVPEGIRVRSSEVSTRTQVWASLS